MITCLAGCPHEAHRDDAMNRRCNGCEKLVRFCICTGTKTKLRYVVYNKANHRRRWDVVAVFRYHGEAVHYVNDMLSLTMTYQIRTLGA